MKFVPTALDGVIVVECEPRQDERGFFARSWCEREAQAHGLEPVVRQCNVSYNHRRGTLRGMHYQAVPNEEVKLVRCTSGALLDVVVDVRPTSPTYGRYVAVELSAGNRKAPYIPKGCAHGFLTLADATEVFYQMSQFHSPDHARGFRWNDPFFGIEWPIPVSIISERDRAYPDFVPLESSAAVRSHV